MFTKGRSGNPGGRPKAEGEVRDLARKYTKDAIERLVHWMKSENAKASVVASQALLDRGYGKPGQAVELTGKGGGPLQAVIQIGPKPPNE